MTDSGTRAARAIAAVVLAATVGLAAVVTVSGLAWVGRPFPGFFLLRNRVVASVSLPGWPVTVAPEVFQATVVAVDHVPVATAAAVYARVRAKPAGTRFAYTLERNGRSTIEAFESRPFTWGDAVLIFGAYLFDGLVFAAIGVWVWVLNPRRTSTWALLGFCLSFSTYVLTAVDLYGPHHFFRLHAMAECFLPASLLHLALVFPVRQMRPLKAAAVSYLPAVLLALVYQLRLDSPVSYPGVHSVATACLVGCGLSFLGTILWSYLRSPSQLVRHRVRFVALGGVVAFALPSAILTVSVLYGGRVPVNMTAFTAFVFPLSIAYAVQKRDLFAIDALVQRGFHYAILSGVVSAVYLAVAALATHVLHLSRFGQSATFSLGFTLAMLIVLPRVRERIQRVVDTLFGRRTYDAQEVLAASSTALGATLALDEILHLTVTIPGAVLGLERVAVFLRSGAGFAEAATEPPLPPGGAPRGFADGRPLTRLLTELPEPLVRDSVADRPGVDQAACLADFDTAAADLIVPLACQSELTGFLAFGRSRRGAFFSAGDVSFLRTFANQAALALQNAQTYHDLELLNRDLERRVNERTQQLADSTDQVTASLAQLGAAYRTLQASQEQLIAAQKMAAFGRLAAGIAHEMNTPLGAALNGLKIARDLAGECEAVVADATASAAERQAVFGELAGMIDNVEEWTHKAAAYIRSVKSHARGAGGNAAPFDLARLLERDLQPLLTHRLRLVGGTIDLRLAADLPELYGDATRLGQVLANLLNNAIDACEGLPPERTRIAIEAAREGDEVVLHVRDRATGIPDHARERIFEAFYTTKPPGRGTGLGLAIARDIVTGEFGGTLVCTVSDPSGTTFTIRLPVARETRAAAADAAA